MKIALSLITYLYIELLLELIKLYGRYNCTSTSHEEKEREVLSEEMWRFALALINENQPLISFRRLCVEPPW